MKGFFKDSSDWDIIVWGDWRGKDGKVSLYNKEVFKQIHFTGGVGYYYFFIGKFDLAIKFYELDLAVIRNVEKIEKRRFHKGLFYFQIHLCYKNLGKDKLSNKYLGLAKRQDLISYGKKAKNFPSFKK